MLTLEAASAYIPHRASSASAEFCQRVEQAEQNEGLSRGATVPAAVMEEDDRKKKA